MDEPDEANERQALLGQPPAVEQDERTGFARLSRLKAVACLCALSVLIMLQATNMSVLTVAQSAIASDLDAFEESSWFTSAYLIAASSSAPIYGKLAAILSPRTTLAVSATLIAIGTLLTSLSNGFTFFIVGRAITGVGGGGVFTVALIIAMEIASHKRRGLMVGAMNTVMTIGVSLGATIAGALLPLTGWRALFWMQTITAVLSGGFVFYAIPRDLGSRKASDHTVFKALARQDYIGAVTLTLSIVLLLLAVSSPTSIPITPIIASLVVFAFFVPYELYVAQEPIVPLALLRSRGLFFASLATVGYMMSRWTILFYMPSYSIAVRDWPPAAGGAMLIPTNLGFAAGGLIVGWLHIRGHKSFYWSSLATFVIFPLTLLALSFVCTPDSSPWVLLLIVFANGFATGASVNYTFAHVLYITPKHTHYMVTSITATFRGFAGSFASAAGGGYFVRSLREALMTEFADRGLTPRDGLIRRLLGSPALVQQLEGAEREAAVEGYAGALRALWQGAAVIALLFILAQASTGWAPPQEEEAVMDDDE